MKDRFSAVAHDYARYRPTYPPELFEFLCTIVPGREAAWDCGTGNGQVAALLSPLFARVEATDISAEQLKNAAERPNISYRLSPAESAPFDDASFDLITVAQAVHWFDFARFYGEAKRTLRPGGILAIIGYPAPRVHPAIDDIIREFYSAIVGSYWDPERRYVEEEYATIPFPFPELPAPRLSFTAEWTSDGLIGYLRSWSASQNYLKERRVDPTDLIRDRIAAAWGNAPRLTATFPLLLRIGRRPR